MRVAVIITARPSYARIKSAISSLIIRGADVTILACASALLERYGRVVDVIREDFPYVPIEECWSTVEGATLETSARETGLLLVELAGSLRRLQHENVVVVADRHEVLAAAQAASYLHLRLWHVQGGERTGSIDDKCRDSITALADHHLVATERARYRVYGLTGDWESIYVTGCPSIDLAKASQADPLVSQWELGGSHAYLDPKKDPFILVLFHPVTNEADSSAAQMTTLLDTIAPFKQPKLILWPGEDAGADAISKRIRLEAQQGTIHTLRNLRPERFLRLLTQCAVLVGNSSVGIRECSYLGVPVVNIGSRQQGRERGPNVVDVTLGQDWLQYAIASQIAHGPYPSSTLYGDGTAGDKIAQAILSYQPLKTQVYQAQPPAAVEGREL